MAQLFLAIFVDSRRRDMRANGSSYESWWWVIMPLVFVAGRNRVNKTVEPLLVPCEVQPRGFVTQMSNPKQGTST